MIIGYDLHGVLTEDPEFYQKELEEHHNWGNEIWIVSGPPRREIADELATLGYIQNVHYDHIASVVDYLLAARYVYELDVKNNYWFDEKIWWKSKSEICTKHNIIELYDNEEQYAPWFISIGIQFVLVKHLPHNGNRVLFRL